MELDEVDRVDLADRDRESGEDCRNQPETMTQRTAYDLQTKAFGPGSNGPFLLAVDTLCRTIATIEVPPGVLTALIGTPFFLWLFALSRRPW